MFFFFNDTATTEIYTLSLHDALPISFQPSVLDLLDLVRDEAQARHVAPQLGQRVRWQGRTLRRAQRRQALRRPDRKSTRLNSSHANISYAVFCLKKKTYSPRSFNHYA